MFVWIYSYFTAMCDGELDAFLVEQKETSKNFTFADALDFAEARRLILFLNIFMHHINSIRCMHVDIFHFLILFCFVFLNISSELINEIFKDYDVKEQGYLTLSVLVRIGQIFQPELSASSLQQKFNLPSADGQSHLFFLIFSLSYPLICR